MCSIRSFLLRMEGSWICSKRLLCLGFVFVALATAPEGWARLGPQYQMALGNPDGASTNSASRTKFLINQRAQYAISYNDDTHQPNWVSWSYSLEDDGTQARTDAWQTEELLPSGYLKIGTATFGTTVNNGVTNSWDRGHMCPSADRTKDLTNNQVTFRMSNIIPQHANNNQGLWATFEDYTRTLANGGNEILIITGPAEFSGSTIANGMRIPGSVWKIAVVVPDASSTIPANQRLTTSARVIALLTPNIGYTNGLINNWKNYRTSVEQIEQVTGFKFFSEVDPVVATYLKNLVDTGTGPNAPTVITSFSPSFGTNGTTVTISGYNFGSAPVVEFDGTASSSVNVVNANTLTATVPSGATTGYITVTGTGGMDTSATEFTVTSSGSTSTFSLSAASLTGLTANEGSAGSSRVYTVTGSSLTNAITVTAPTNFEVSLNNSFFSASVSLTPVAGALSGVPVYVRIQAGAPVGAVAGNVTHVGGGATSQNLNVSGNVASTAPFLTLSTTNLAGFTAVQGSAGISKSYILSGANLTGNITVGAPSNFEISLSSSGGYTNSLTLNPSTGTLSNTAVFVRIRSSAPLGSVSGTVSHTGGGAFGVDLGVSGSVSTSGGGGGSSVVLAQWTFESVTTGATNPAFGPTYAESGLQAGLAALSGLHASSATVYSTPTGNGSLRAISANNWTTNDYYQIKVSSLGYGGLKLTFDQTGSSTGPSQFLVSYSTNGTNFSLYSNYDLPKTNGVVVSWSSGFSNNASTVALDLGSVADLNNQSDVFFRFVMRSTLALNGTTVASGGTSRLDNVTLEATAIGGVTNAAPVINSATNATATAYEAFIYTISATNGPTSFAASGLPAGLSLNSTNGVISGTPTTVGQYVVALTASNAGGDGTGTLTLTVHPNPNAPVIGGTLSATGQVGTAFDYQMTASNSPTSYLAEGLPAGLSLHPTTGRIAGTPTVSGSFAVLLTALNAVGSDTETLALTIKNPSLTISVGQLSGFSANVGTVSSAQSYTLSGADLSGTVTVTAPAPFEISLDGTSYADSLPLSPNGSGILSLSLAVRLSASAPAGVHSGSISHTGGGALPSYLLLQGEAISLTPVLTLSTNSLAAFSTTQGKPSIRQVYTANGSSLLGNISISCPPGFELSLNDETYASTATLTPIAGTLPETSIYVRLTGTTQGTFSGFLAHGGGGVATQSVAVTGQVTAALGPPILSPLSGSVYTNASFQHTILAGGDTSVTYGASGLPGGWTINPTNGLISGTAASSAGTATFTVSATNLEGVTTVSYGLRTVNATEQGNVPTSVVVNKFVNGSPDRVELLVIGDTNDLAAGPPVDMRGMILKDFSSSRTVDQGGKYRFTDHNLWTSVKAGTLIVLSAGTTSAEDLDPADFLLRLNLGNATFFKQESPGFDLDNLDMVMVKPAAMGAEGFAGGIHALAAGQVSGLTVYGSFTGKKLRSNKALTSSNNIVYANGSSLADFSSTSSSATGTVGNLVFGQGNTSGNTTYISTLRNTDQTPPTVTLIGSSIVNLTVGDPYLEQGASVTGGISPAASVSGSVNTSTAGTYVLTYSASDSNGNVGTATRTVVVRSKLNDWAWVYGFSENNINLMADADGDGIPNLAEYALGGNPTNASGDVLPVLVQSNVNSTNYLYLTYRARTNDANLTIQPKTSADLANTNGWVASGYEQVTNRAISGQTNHVERVIRMPIDGVTRRFLKLDINQTNAP